MLLRWVNGGAGPSHVRVRICAMCGVNAFVANLYQYWIFVCVFFLFCVCLFVKNSNWRAKIAIWASCKNEGSFVLIFLSFFSSCLSSIDYCIIFLKFRYVYLFHFFFVSFFLLLLSVCVFHFILSKKSFFFVLFSFNTFFLCLYMFIGLSNVSILN